MNRAEGGNFFVLRCGVAVFDFVAFIFCQKLIEVVIIIFGRNNQLCVFVDVFLNNRKVIIEVFGNARSVVVAEDEVREAGDNNHAHDNNDWDNAEEVSVWVFWE